MLTVVLMMPFWYLTTVMQWNFFLMQSLHSVISTKTSDIGLYIGLVEVLATLNTQQFAICSC